MQGFGIRLPKGEDKFGKGEDVSAIREGENKIRDGVLKKGKLKQYISPTLEEENKIVEETFPIFLQQSKRKWCKDGGRAPATH